MPLTPARTAQAAAPTRAPPARNATRSFAPRIDVFADRGFFNAQVADVARAAGVAAGTVYLYFKSKDDLLVSIFERSMREGARTERAPRSATSDDPRGAAAPSCARLISRGLGRDRNLAIVFQVELRQSTKFMERFSSTLLRDYLGLIREAIADGQRDRPVPRRREADRRRRRCCSARSTRWRPTGSSSRRRYSLEADADTVVDLFINGAQAR